MKYDYCIQTSCIVDLIDLRMHACAPKFNTYHNYYYIGARTTKATSFLGNEKCQRSFDPM